MNETREYREYGGDRKKNLLVIHRKHLIEVREVIEFKESFGLSWEDVNRMTVEQWEMFMGIELELLEYGQ